MDNAFGQWLSRWWANLSIAACSTANIEFFSMVNYVCRLTHPGPNGLLGLPCAVVEVHRER